MIILNTINNIITNKWIKLRLKGMISTWIDWLRINLIEIML